MILILQSSIAFATSTTQHTPRVAAPNRTLHYRNHQGTALAAAGLTYLALCDSAAAIPSPELVVGSLTSLSQLAALGSAIIGGGAIAAGARAGRGNAPMLTRLALVFGVLSVVLLALNIHQWTQHQSQRRAELEATLTRPTAKSTSGSTLDAALREVSFKDQSNHPLGLSTDQAERIVSDVEAGRQTPWIILDIRESAEAEMGSFKNATRIRFPDLPTATIDLTKRKALLICHNGNRSAETCAALHAKGIECGFIKGGLEKWLTEGRRIGDSPVRSLDDIRAIPHYPNNATLFETADVHRLVDEEAAVFVDVRYPGEFSASHLPGAINLPLRPTPTADMKKMLAAVPDKPVIAPCYDRRSCFFAEILGLELTRIGKDFRGRYTLPWEYFQPSARPPHIEAWLANANKGLWIKASEALQAALATMAGHTGLPLALLVLALISRTLILPFSIKAERDHMTSQRMAPELERIKAATKQDPARMSRAIQALYRANGLTPLRNMIALLFLPVLALSVDAAVAVAQNDAARNLWLPSLYASDPLYILPVLFSGLLTAYIDWALVSTSRQRAACWLVLAPLLFIAGSILPSAANIYVIFSAALLLLQRAIVIRLPQALWTAARRRAASWRTRSLRRLGALPLADIAAADQAGNKATRLAKMRGIGLPVPNGVVLTEPLLSGYASMTERQRSRMLRKIARTLLGQRFAVRSSGAAEDGPQSSYAGVYESLLDVRRAGLDAAVTRVLASFSAERVASYSATAANRNILIQPMIDAEYAGVLFSRAPHAPGSMLVEAVKGNAEALVSGRASPSTFQFGRSSSHSIAGGEAPIAFGPLLTLARRIETLFGRPQDIEWAYAKGQFYILQARDITTVDADPVSTAWFELANRPAPSAATDIVYRQTVMSELLPRPTPLSLSLMNDIWASGGSVDLALRSLGVTAEFPENSAPLLITVYGRLYCDARQEALHAPKLNRLALRRINAAGDAIVTDFNDRFKPNLLARIRLLDAVDFNAMPVSDLTSLATELRRTFVTETYVDVETINIVAQVYHDAARKALTAHGVDALAHLAGTLDTSLEQQIHAAQSLDDQGQLLAYRAALGHRAHFDYELSEPRFGEDDKRLLAAAGQFASTKNAGQLLAIGQPAALSAKLAKCVARARRFETLKEDAKHLVLRELATLRRLAVALGKKTGMETRIFHLTFDEIVHLDATNLAALNATAAERQRHRDAFRVVPPLPTALTLIDLERGPYAITDATETGGAIKGTRVSGRTAVCGRARVVSLADCETGAPIPAFRDGDIIVAPMLHPAWLPELVRSGGAVCEVGGWLSHMAIVARERGIALITGVSGLATLADGTELILEMDGRVTLAATIRETALAAE